MNSDTQNESKSLQEKMQTENYKNADAFAFAKIVYKITISV